MPSYSELLKDERWRNRRQAIISRDSFTCQNCQNENVIKNCEKGTASIDRFGFIKLYNSNFKWFSLFRISNLIKISAPKNSTIYYSIEGNNRPKIMAFLNNNNRYLYVPSLHVHHKYYQDGYKPWEYPDHALITLCWVCHEELHSSIQIPRLNSMGVEIGKMTPCIRCHGAGEFPEYKHIQAGICFRCIGACYEELII